MLYLNGMSLLHRSTKFRKRNLRSCLKEVSGRIEFVTEYEGKTAKDIRLRMDDIMANRGEGLVLKHPDAEYVLNGRNKDWIKVKPEYMVSSVSTPNAYSLVDIGRTTWERRSTSSSCVCSFHFVIWSGCRQSSFLLSGKLWHRETVRRRLHADLRSSG